MSPEQLTAVLVAFGGVLGAIAIVLQRIHELRGDLNGRLQELIDSAVEAAQKRGELAGRDFMHERMSATPPPPSGSSQDSSSSSSSS